MAKHCPHCLQLPLGGSRSSPLHRRDVSSDRWTDPEKLPTLPKSAHKAQALNPPCSRDTGLQAGCPRVPSSASEAPREPSQERSRLPIAKISGKKRLHWGKWLENHCSTFCPVSFHLSLKWTDLGTAEAMCLFHLPEEHRTYQRDGFPPTTSVP